MDSPVQTVKNDKSLARDDAFSIWSDAVVVWIQCGGPERVACGGGVDSMLQFRLERGGDRTKRCWKMNRRQRARLGSIGRKCDTMRWCDDVDRSRDGTEERKGRRRCHLGLCESYRAKKWRKFIQLIQLVEMDGEDLNHQWVNLI
jgi:hypothetical protein